MGKYSFLKNRCRYINPGSFESYGGWSLDTQFYSTVKSEYLLAHGTGTPVADAETKTSLPHTGTYNIWVRTKNWVGFWKPDAAAGIFKLKINGKEADTVFGRGSHSWHWQYGGRFNFGITDITVSLCDITGFEGRCGGILFCDDTDFIPPDSSCDVKELIEDISQDTYRENKIKYDLIVCGGGIAGICTAVSAARNGIHTALIQDRGILGGNNSSEVRVWLGGERNFEPYPNIGNIVRELEQEITAGYGYKNTAEIYEDEKKLSVVTGESNIDLYLNTIVCDAVTISDTIHALKLYNVKDGTFSFIKSELFADCSGDGDAAYYSGADFEMTSNGHMGMTNMWNVKDTGKPTTFPDCSSWTMDLSGKDFPGRRDIKSIYGQSREEALGSWYWESGMELDPILYAEYSRDLNFRAMYSAWHTLKNIDNDYQNYIINHSSYIGGKRESRRFLGDVILTKCDVHKKYQFPDACVPTTWDFDVHYPDSRFYSTFSEGDAFLSKDCHEKFEIPYFIPYRCLYSRNIKNLFFAGRNISVTHDALGSVRVMRTGGMMGEVIGKAAALCIQHGCFPRDIYYNHLDKLKSML